MTITTTTMTITPAMATEWLTRNTHNRTLNERVATAYARDIKAGKWDFNGETIKIAADGTLLDGQHRLRAIIIADTPIEVIVVQGLPTKTQDTMDLLHARKQDHIYQMRGESNASSLSAGLTRIWQYDQGDHKHTGNLKPTLADKDALLNERPEIRRSVELAAWVRGKWIGLPASTLVTSHHLLSRIPDTGDQLPWFMASLATGAELSDGSPVLALRNRVTSDRINNTKVPTWYYMACTFRAWNAIREGRTLTKIQQPYDGPMPTPK